MGGRRFTRWVGLVALCALVGGCAVADTGAFVRLQEDMENLKKEVATLRARNAGQAVPSPVAAGGDADSLRRSLADLTSDNDRIKADLLALSSRVDDVKLDLQKEVSRLNGTTTELGQSIAALQGKMAEDEKRLAALEGQKGAVAPGKPPVAAPPPVSPQDLSTPEAMYDYALGLIKAGETKKAREVLNAFAGKYPDNKLMQNVYYWKGETFYSEKDYESAILSFQDVIDKYPAGNKAPDAMLKQGLAFLSLKDRKNAKTLFELLQTKYPRSPAAAKAREKLLELK